MENNIIEKFRNKNPEFKEFKDEDIAKHMYQEFSKNKEVKEEDFYDAIGMKDAFIEKAIEEVKPEEYDWTKQIEEKTPAMEKAIEISNKPIETNNIIEKFRNKNPEFKEFKDEDIAKHMYQEFSKNKEVKEKDFYDAINFIPPEDNTPKVELNTILNPNKDNIDIPDVPTLRTSTEAMGDTFHAMGAGVGNVIKGAGTISGLVTGDMNNPVVQFGSQMSDDFKDQYSSQKKQWDKEDREKINAQDGEINKAIQVLKNYADTPQNIVMDLTEQIPQIGAMFLGGAGTKATAEVLGATPKIAGKVGTTGAITTEAGLSGADSGGDAYESIMRLPDEVWNNSPEYQILIKSGIEPNKAKEAMALEESRFAAGITGALTFGLNKFLPNADMIEKALVGDMSGIAAKGLAGKAAGVASETFVEGADEAQSKINSNIAIQNIDPNQTLTSGVGEASAKGAVLGGATSSAIAIADSITPKSDEQKKQIIENELNKSIENADLQQEDILNQINPNQAYYQQQNINNSPTPIVETPIANKQLEDITAGFAKLQEEIKANNEKPIEELLQKDLEVKVTDEPTTNPILDNNIIPNQEVQNQDSTLPVSTIEEISSQSAINANENVNVSTQTNELDNNSIPQIDETQWHSIPDNMNVKVSQGSNRVNELTVKDLNKNDDPYIYETAEFQGEQGVLNTINRRLATNEELTQKNKNRLVDTKFQDYFTNGKIDEDGFMTTKSMSKEQFKEFNDYIKENNIGSYVNKKYSQGGKTGFKIDNQEVINTFGTPKVETETSPTPAITPIVENVTPQNSERNSSIITNEIGDKLVEINKTTKNSSVMDAVNYKLKMDLLENAINEYNQLPTDKQDMKDLEQLNNTYNYQKAKHESYMEDFSNSDILKQQYEKALSNKMDSVVKENLTSENQVENVIPQIDENNTKETEVIAQNLNTEDDTTIITEDNLEEWFKKNPIQKTTNIKSLYQNAVDEYNTILNNGEKSQKANITKALNTNFSKDEIKEYNKYKKLTSSQKTQADKQTLDNYKNISSWLNENQSLFTDNSYASKLEKAKNKVDKYYKQLENKSSKKSKSNSMYMKSGETFEEKIINTLDSDKTIFEERPYTLEEWNSLFPNNKILSPIGEITLGKNQFAKLDPTIVDPKNTDRKKQDRRGHIDYIYKTLIDPTYIVKKDNQYIFIKEFIKDDNSTRKYSSIVVEKDGLKINISNHNLHLKQVIDEIKKADSVINTVEVTTNQSTNSDATSTLVADESITKLDENSQDNISEKENEILYSKGFDISGNNYIPVMKIKGFPERPTEGKIKIENETIELPTYDNPQTIETVRVFLKDIIGNRLYDGRVRGQSKLGFYNKINTGIRVKDYHDIEVQAHEMAHYLDFYYKNPTKKESTSFFRNFKIKNKNFLKSVSYTQSKDLSLTEGFAEFLRLYTTQYNNLIELDGAKDVIKDFESTISADKDLEKKLKKYREESHKYYFQGSIERMSATSDSSLSKEAEKIKKRKEKKLTEWKQRVVDKNLSIKIAEEFLKGKEPLDTDDSAYKLFNLVSGSEGTVDMALEYGVPFVDEKGDVQLDETKKGLDKIFKPLFDKGFKEVRLWENYAKARRGKELLEQGRENRIDKQMIEESLNLEKEYPHFKTIFEEYQEFNNSMLDFYVGMKLITSEQKQAFQDLNNEYIPFHRVRESISQGKTVQQTAQSRIGTRLIGGSGTIANIMDNIYAGIEKNVKDAYIARAKSSLFEMLSKDGAEFAMKINKDSKLVRGELESQSKNVSKVLYELGLGITKDGMIVNNGEGIYQDVFIEIEDIKNILQENPELLEMWSMGHKPTSKDKMIDSAIIDGKKVYFEINDPMIIETLNSQKGVMIENIYLKTAVNYKNISTFLITNNPLFYLTNAFRDTISAGMMSDNGFIPFLDTLRGMSHYIKRDKMYKNFMVSGAGYSTRRTALGNYDDINSNNGIAKRHFGAFQKAVNILAYGADLFEYGTRIGEFAKAKQQGKSNIHSAYSGREVSTDFSRSGSSENFRKFVSTVAFAKAGINSIDKVYRRFRDKKTTKDKIVLAVAGGAIATFSIMLSMMNDDDERYNQLTKDQKSMYWWVYLDKFIPKEILKELGINPIWKLPKPYDIGILFGNIPEMSFEYLRGTADLKELKDRFLFDLFRSGGLMDYPSVLKGVIEVGFNKNWQGKPIENLGMQFTSKKERFTEYTPEIYKRLGNDFLSPVQLHHLSNSILGLYGRMIDDALEATLWNEEKGERAFARYNPLDYLTQRLQGREVESRTKYSDRFYEYYKKMVEVQGDYRNIIKQKDNKKLKELKEDKEKIMLLKMKSNADSTAKKLSEINKVIERVKTGKTNLKTAEEKENKINQLLKIKQKIVLEGAIKIEEKLKNIKAEEVK